MLETQEIGIYRDIPRESASTDYTPCKRLHRVQKTITEHNNKSLITAIEDLQRNASVLPPLHAKNLQHVTTILIELGINVWNNYQVMFEI